MGVLDEDRVIYLDKTFDPKRLRFELQQMITQELGIDYCDHKAEDLLNVLIEIRKVKAMERMASATEMMDERLQNLDYAIANLTQAVIDKKV